MNKLKKVLSFTFLAAAAVGVTATGICLEKPASQDGQNTSYASFSPAEIPIFGGDEFFDVSGTNRGVFFASKATDSTKLSISSKAKLGKQEFLTSGQAPAELVNNGDFVFKYTPDTSNPNSYYYFDFSTPSITVDGEEISIVQKTTNEGGENKPDETYGTSANDLIMSSKAKSKFPSGSDVITPETLSFDIKYEKGDNSSIKKPTVNDDSLEFTPATLTLNKTGLLRISVDYTLHYVSISKQSDDLVENEYDDYPRNGNFTFECLFLNNDDYFNDTSSASSNNIPRISYPSDVLTRANTASGTHQYNYFYNYQSNSLPYISYNPNNLRMSVTKNYNNTAEKETYVFDPESHDFEILDGNNIVKAESFLYDINYKTEDGSVELYFNDVGTYTLEFDLIYTRHSGESYQVYTVDKSVKNQLAQNVFLFGTQMQYTDYDSNSSTTQFKEFKTVKEHAVTRSADVTAIVNGLKKDKANSLSDTSGDSAIFDALKEYEANPKNNFTIAKTNQTPIKFLYNLSSGGNVTVWDVTDGSIYTETQSEDGSPATKTVKTSESATITKPVKTGENATITKTFSNAGKYFVKVEYTFAAYTDANGSDKSTEEHVQYYYFEIEKKTPQIEVYDLDRDSDYRDSTELSKTLSGDHTFKQLPSSSFTNKSVVAIYYPEYSNEFASTVLFRIQKQVFDGISGQAEASHEFKFDENGLYFVEAEGKYTIYIQYRSGEGDDNAIRRTFTIDRQAIQEIAVNPIVVENDLQKIVTSPVGNLTNQSFIFSWKNVKPSGATTKAYFRYFPLKDNDILTNTNGDTNISSMLQAFLGDNGANSALPTNKTLDLTNADKASWPQYYNPKSYFDTQAMTVPESFVKSAAGLYIFEVIDAAGNSAVQLVLLDNSTPTFVKLSGSTYSVIGASFETLSNDATIVWGKHKSIFVDGFSDKALNGETVTDNALFQNYSGDNDQAIYNAFKELFGNRLKTYSDGRINSQYTGDNHSFLEIEMEKNSSNHYLHYYKDRSRDSYEPVSDAFSKDIASSFTVHYAEDNGSTEYFFSTSPEHANNTGYNDYLWIKSDGTRATVQATGGSEGKINVTINNRQVELKDATVYKRTVNGEASFYYTKEQSTSVTTSTQLIPVLGGANVAYNESEFAVAPFVDMEGTYVFLIRDGSNTQGRDRSESDRFLMYPSAYQYIKVTGDSSLSRFFYKTEENGKEVERDLDEAAYSPTSAENEGEDVKMTKNTYYNPTYVSTLYVSFIPTVTLADGKKAQVDKVTLAYYPYVTKKVAYLYGGTEPHIAYYKTLATEPFSTSTLYSYDDANGHQEQTSAITIAVNPYQGNTQPGKYVLTRTYKTGENFAIGAFDYNTRILTAIDDRDNVITRPDSVQYTQNLYTYTYNGATFTARAIENILDIEVTSGNANSLISWLQSNLTINDKKIEQASFTGVGSHYYYDNKEPITSFSFNGAAQQEDSPVTSTLTSVESLVGKDIFVNMYDSGNGASEISIAFPHYEGLLPNGETFYTQANTSSQVGDSASDPSAQLETNKAPVVLYIPSVKYTLYSNLNDQNEFTVFENNALNRFDKDVSGSQILSYNLSATIKFTSTEDGSTETYTSQAGENGFLKFFDSHNSEISSLNKAGKYVVTIVQGANEAMASTFKKDYRFTFIIQEDKANFDVLANGRQVRSLKSNDNLLYTNSNKIELTWRDSNSLYMADIDKTDIRLSIGSWERIISINEDTKVVTLSGTDNTQYADAFKFSVLNDGLTNLLSIDLVKLNAYNHGTNIKATMRLEGPEDIARRTEQTKTVVIDKQADVSKVQGLIDKLSAFSTTTFPLNMASLRRNLDETGNEIEGIGLYNVSQNDNLLARYSYLAREDFFTNLRGYVNENFEGISYAGESVEAFFKEIEDPYNNSAEVSWDSFVEGEYTKLTENDVPTKQNSYYEIVERDLAGNLTIYLVYYYSEYSGEDEGDFQGISFVDNDADNSAKSATDAQIIAGGNTSQKLNLYSSTNISDFNLNFLGDEWMRLTIGGANYMFSPRLTGNLIDMASGNTVAIDSIFSGLTPSANAIPLYISNRATGASIEIRLTLLNGTELLMSYMTGPDTEGLSVSYGTIFPVSVQIFAGNGSNATFDVTNDPNALENLTADYSFLTAWQAVTNPSIVVSANLPNRRLEYVFRSRPTTSLVIKYVITDNFGNVTQRIHSVGNREPDRVTAAKLYTYQVADETTGGQTETYYLASDRLTFNFNNGIYTATLYEWNNGWKTLSLNATTNSYISYYTLELEAGEHDRKFKAELREISTTGEEMPVIETVYMRVYDQLPELLTKDGTQESDHYYIYFVDNLGINISDILQTATENTTVEVNGKAYKETMAGVTFANRIRVNFSDSSALDFPYAVYAYKTDGSLGGDFVRIDSQTRYSDSGTYYFLIKYDPAQFNPSFTGTEGIFEENYLLWRIDIQNSNQDFYSVTLNGQPLQESAVPYMDGREQTEYYIVNVDYDTNKTSVQVIGNPYQKVNVYDTDYKNEADKQDPDWTGANQTIHKSETPDGTIVTHGWHVTNKTKDGYPDGVYQFDKYIYVTFMPYDDHPVDNVFYTFDEINLIPLTNLETNSVAPLMEEDPSIDSLKIFFSTYSGIESNTISASVMKDGVRYFPEVKSKPINSVVYNYIELSTSGTYQIRLSDVAGNVQSFGPAKVLNLTFLKDVLFSMTFTNADGEEVTTDPIQKGVFNRQVVLTLINKDSYYTTTSIGSGAQMIKAYKNGSEDEYTGYVFDATAGTFTFNEPGYYSVSFAATSQANNAPLREIVYNFTIVDPTESRYSFEFSPYSSYYVESIVRAGVDISHTADGKVADGFKQELFPTVIVNGREYLRSFVTMFADSELTGQGEYIVTIATQLPLTRNNYGSMDDSGNVTINGTKFSFNYRINTAQVPIDVSVNEGESTSKDIRVSFNAERVYTAIGDCVVTIGSNVYTITAENYATLGVVNQTISASGTYFITVHSMSGNLLYSYKVVKTEPLNAWAIAAIVIAGIVAIVVVVLVFTLRKRIKVK